MRRPDQMRGYFLLAETQDLPETATLTPEKARTGLMLILCSKEASFTILKQFAFETKNRSYDPFVESSLAERFSDHDAEQLHQMGKCNALADLSGRYVRLNQILRHHKNAVDIDYAQDAPALANELRIPNDSLLIAIAGHLETVIAPDLRETDWHKTLVATIAVVKEDFDANRRFEKLMKDDCQSNEDIDRRFLQQDKEAQRVLGTLLNLLVDSSSPGREIAASPPSITTLSSIRQLRQLQQEYKDLPLRSYKKPPKPKYDKTTKLPSRRLAEILEIRDLIPALIAALDKKLGIVEEATLEKAVSGFGRKLKIDREMKGDFALNTCHAKRDRTLSDASFVMMAMTELTSAEAYGNIDFRMSPKVRNYDARVIKARNAGSTPGTIGMP